MRLFPSAVELAESGPAVPLAKRLVQAVVLRSAVALLLVACAVTARVAGIIGPRNLTGTLISGAAILLLAGPAYLATRSTLRSRYGPLVSAVDRALMVACFTGYIYSLGGVEAGYLVGLYAVLTFYVGVVSHWRIPFTVAATSFACFALMASLEHAGLLPHVNVVAGFSMPWHNQLALVGVAGALLFMSAAASARAARTIDAGRRLLERRSEELLQARDRARESDRQKTEFLASMSHELRTPLNHVIGFTEVVLQDLDTSLSAQGREYLDDALRSGRHLLALLNDLLDTASVDAGHMRLERRWVSLPELLGRSITVVKDSAERAGVTVEARLETLPAMAWLDPRRINQVLYNLLANAVKFTPRGGRVTLAAAVAAARDGAGPGEIEVRVIDTGVGLDGHDRARLFGAFERGRSSAAAGVPGTGLGLYVARRIVELHGGTIGAESDGEGRGTTVAFRLPVEHPAAGTEPAPATDPA